MLRLRRRRTHYLGMLSEVERSSSAIELSNIRTYQVISFIHYVIYFNTGDPKGKPALSSCPSRDQSPKTAGTNFEPSSASIKAESIRIEGWRSWSKHKTYQGVRWTCLSHYFGWIGETFSKLAFPVQKLERQSISRLGFTLLCIIASPEWMFPRWWKVDFVLLIACQERNWKGSAPRQSVM